MVNGNDVNVPKPQFDAQENKIPVGRPLILEFTAQTSEYFRLWVVCQFLTLMTLGLYGPWARTRKAQFLALHWWMDGQAFEVKFVPIALLKGRMLVFTLLLGAALLGWWNPWLTPAFILVAFAAAPWLLANSFAFRWRTLRFRDLGFDSDNTTRGLRWPLFLVGVSLALAALPMSLWQTAFKNSWWVALVGAFLIFPFVFFWPRATAALTHYRFAQANWGTQRFVLQATAKEIYSHMWRKAFSGWLIALSVVYGILIYIGIRSGNRDAQAVLSTLGYLLIGVFGITFARSRRLNFVLHRLNIGGLSFTSTMNPTHMSALTAGYAILAVCTMGLSIPWSTVHFCRWRAARVTPYLDGDWSQFEPAASPRMAPGVLDELGNAFDIEIGI